MYEYVGIMLNCTGNILKFALIKTEVLSVTFSWLENRIEIYTKKCISISSGFRKDGPYASRSTRKVVGCLAVSTGIELTDDVYHSPQKVQNV